MSAPEITPNLLPPFPLSAYNALVNDPASPLSTHQRMNLSNPPTSGPSAARWPIFLAFAIVYTAWGTTYLAIKVGVEVLPPGLFGGVRILLAGLILLGFLALRRQQLRLPRQELFWTGLSGICLFVGGNGLITVGEKTVASGVASVLVACTPLWLALLESCWPWGERLRAVGWVGLAIGLTGVLVLLGPKVGRPRDFLQDTGPLLVLGSSFCWAVGSFIMRHQHRSATTMVTAAYQMTIGGICMTVIGLAMGETALLRSEMFWGRGMVAFVYLLVVGSLMGFVAYTYLLGRVSTVLVGTYAYINPAVAILVGWLLGGEAITVGVIGGMVIILAGVALVRTAGGRRIADIEPVRVEIEEGQVGSASDNRCTEEEESIRRPRPRARCKG